MNQIKEHFDKISVDYDFYKRKNKFYYLNLKNILSEVIPKSSTVLEIGCGTGDLLAFLKPKVGYGMDISSGMIKLAKKKYKNCKNLRFLTSYPKNKRFEYIFMSDVIEHLEKPDEVFIKISKLLTKNGVFVNTMANPVWEPVLMFGEKLGLKMPEGSHKRITIQDIKERLKKVNLKIVEQENKLLVPINIPLITDIINNYLEKYLRKYAFIQIFVAKKK